MKSKKKSRKTATVILADKVYVPREVFSALRGRTRASLKDSLRKILFDPHSCDAYSRNLPCPKKGIEGSYNACMHCSEAKIVIKCYRLTEKYFSFDRGDIVLVQEILDRIVHDVRAKYDIEIQDKRVYFKLPQEMRFSSNWDAFTDPARLAEQRRVADAWIKAKGGQIKAPPRFGKTGLGSIIAAASKTRVAVIAHQKELIQQFQIDFYKFTDLEEREKLMGRNLLSINPSVDEVDTLSVCLYTYQQFLNTWGANRLRCIRKKFGLILVDEAHRSSAGEYSSVLSRFWAKYRCGLTATPKRRDQLDFWQNLILGPVVVEGGSEQLPCDYSVEFTGWRMPEYDNMGSRQWNALWNAVTKADKRNAFIADLAKKDLAANYRIVIPVKRIAHLESLREVFIMEGVVTSEELAVLSGRLNKKDRANMVDNIRAGKYKVVIAIDKLVSLGFNAPPLSCIYMNVGSYHFDMNNAYQEYSRVRTAYEGKNKPMIRIMKDDGKISNMSTTKLCKEFERLAFNNKDEQDEEPILDIVPSSKGGPVRTKRKFSI